MNRLRKPAVFVLVIFLCSSVFSVTFVLGDDPPSDPSSITCTISSQSVVLGENVIISGSISPAVEQVDVTLTYTSPNASVVTNSVQSQTGGFFEDVFMPDSAGQWSVKASWLGNSEYLGASSFSVNFAVAGSSSFSVDLTIVVVVVAVALLLGAAYWFYKRW
jgi:hypothetical protein